MTVLLLQCGICRYYLKDWKCVAFPDGIPENLLLNRITHDIPVLGQDNDIVFEEENWSQE